jgi:tRNA threonylcarbamoyladenosine biosynthesis protein TsaE
MIKEIREIKSLSEMGSFAKEILNFLVVGDSATILALHGNLGAGKTAFTKSLAKALGIVEVVNSPTFVIMKMFDISNNSFKKLIHIDAYRIESDRELEVLGWRDLINDPHNLIVIEWPEKVQSLIPKSAVVINFEFVDENTRNVTVNDE